jgi:PAS domain S-box-containing protein
LKNSEQILHERLAAMHGEFLSGLDANMVLIKDYWSGIRFSTPDQERLTAMLDLAQRLVSDGGKFGHQQIATAARNLASFIQALLQNQMLLGDQHYRQVDLLIQLLKSSLRNPYQPDADLTHDQWRPAPRMPHLRGFKPLVLLLEEGEYGSRLLADKLREKGYATEVFKSYPDYRQAVEKRTPSLVITDRIFPDGRLTGKLAPEAIFRRNDHRVPMIFVAYDNDIQVHFDAIRSGCVHYCLTPVNDGKLVEMAEVLISGGPRDPYRVMIIDADRIMTGFYESILRDEGMQVSVIADPLRTIDSVRDYRPELILINLHLPSCTGLELTTVIRQREHLSGISIIFLSTEADFDRQLAAINTGGDDLLTVPVDPQLLITTINSRVERARTLNRINYDLLNALRELENQQNAMDQHAIISICNINGSLIYVNEKFCAISGYPRSEVLGRDYLFLRSDLHDEELYRRIWRTLLAGEVWQGEVCNRKKNGDLYWVNVTMVPFRDEEDRPYQFVSISSDITARIVAEQNMLKARDTAVTANQTKSDFLSKMSHELRTPLNAVMGFSQLLETNTGDDLTDQQRQYVREIRNAGTHLLNLINEVLDLSRIESNQLTVENITIPLALFLDECHALVMPMARDKNITVRKNYRHLADAAVHADPVRLKQVMVNLLSNAIKYNTPAGQVLIQANTQGDAKIVIEVVDTGEGMDASQLDSLFKPFTRLPQHKHEEGVGIGLALSKRLCELMGGSIGVSSKVGVGSRFWIALDRMTLQDLDDDAGARHAAAKPGGRLLDNLPLKLIYIEDNLANFKLVREILLSHPGLSLQHAETVPAGIELAVAQRPDIILMDLQLPGMDGYEGLRHLRTLQGMGSLPVIAISAFANEENIRLAISEGFDDYITKPIDIDGLLNSLNRVIERRNLYPP